LGVFEAIEEFAIAIAIIGATSIMFFPIFIFNTILNTPTRNSPLFYISISSQRCHGRQYNGLPDAADNLTWWSVHLYLESMQPDLLELLHLKIGLRRYKPHEMERIEFKGANDIYHRLFYFEIPDSTQFGRQKVEIIATTSKDDYGTSKFIIKQ
ncbi:MAG: hypothetical protein ACXADH_15600, partial [Candidatus Kariarchaeaceae archaeon]|jgi:hypothetical protein